MLTQPGPESEMQRSARGCVVVGNVSPLAAPRPGELG